MYIILSLQCLSEAAVDRPSEIHSSESVSEENLVCWTDVMWGYISKATKIKLSEKFAEVIWLPPEIFPNKLRINGVSKAAR